MILLNRFYIKHSFLNDTYKFNFNSSHFLQRLYTWHTFLKVNMEREKMFSWFKSKRLMRNSEKQIHTKFLSISANWHPRKELCNTFPNIYVTAAYIIDSAEFNQFDLYFCSEHVIISSNTIRLLIGPKNIRVWCCNRR